MQAKVRTYIAQKGPTSESKPNEVKSITVPISTFPPTAMVYNVSRASISKSESLSSDDDQKPPVDVVSAAIMAKVLEDREKERIFARHCDTCTCHRSVLKVNSEMQTVNVFNTCNECQTRQDSSKGNDFLEEKEKTTKKMDYLKNDRTGKLHYNQIRDSYSHSIFPEVNECSKTFNKIRTQNSSKNPIYHYVNEVAESKNNQKFENSKTTNRSLGLKNYSNFKNSMKHQNSLNSQNITAETKLLAPENPEDKQEVKAEIKASKKHNHWNDGGHASQVEIINDRLWKSSWTKSEFHDFNQSNDDYRSQIGKDTHIDVINDRVWKHNKSKTKEAKPTQLTLIKVASVDELTNNSEIRPESTVSPSFSSDSIIFSTSDPSSISSDVQSTNKGLSKQEKKNCNINLQTSKQERTPGPRNCVMRVSGKSNNILLDNVGSYQPILTANSVTFPNTALVHATSSCRSGRTVSTSSEENSSILSPDNVHLQRVAEWVKSSVQLDKSSNQSHKLSTETKHFNQFSREESLEIKEQNVVESFESVEKDVEKKEKDLITFDPSSDEEKDCNDLKVNSSLDDHFDVNVKKENLPLDNHYEVNNVSIGDSTLNEHYEVKVTKEMEETYLKLTASLDPVALRLASMTGADLTIEKYRKDHKRLQTQKIPSKSSSST